MSIAQEPDLKARLGIPEHVAACALIPMGYPARRLTRLRRSPVEQFANLEQWGGGPLSGAAETGEG